MKVEVYDDFLDDEKFRWVQREMLGSSFNWHLSTVLDPKVDTVDCNQLENIQFSNWMYHGLEPGGPEYGIVEPFISDPRLGITALVRIKANLTMRTPKVITHGFHKDGKCHHTSAIYYVNSNDGYTEFEDGTQIESVENRLLVFDSQISHTGSTCTNARVRCVINFNYYTSKHITPEDGHTEGS